MINTDFLLKNVAINSKYIDICCSKGKYSCSIIIFHNFWLKWGNYGILKIFSFWLKKMTLLKTYRPVKTFNKVSEENNYLFQLYRESPGRQSYFAKKLLYRGFQRLFFGWKPHERSEGGFQPKKSRGNPR